MGATVEQEHGYVIAHTDGQLLGTRHVLEFPSVGATENLLMAGTLAKGVTVIDNAAREPEVTELCAFLNRMGGHVLGGGTSCIEVHGVEELEPAEMHLIGDRIEVGTLLIGCAMTGGEIELEGAQLDHVEIMARKLADMGMLVSPTADGDLGSRIAAAARRRHRHVAVPGRRNRPDAARGCHAHGLRRIGHRHREHLREPFPVRGRARTHGR